jgi:hypothetical protein
LRSPLRIGRYDERPSAVGSPTPEAAASVTWIVVAVGRTNGEPAGGGSWILARMKSRAAAREIRPFQSHNIVTEPC